jgi:UPF0176 protein
VNRSSSLTTIGTAMTTRPPVAAVLAAAVLLAGCSATALDRSAPEEAPTSPVLSTASAAPPAPTVTSTLPGTAVIASAPPATPEPPPVDGRCPYLADEAVADINGQRTGTTRVIEVQPYPICIFSRTDGEWLASVRIISAGTPQAAVAAVDAHVPIDSSDPADQPAGWSGGSMVTESGSVYAVSRGSVAIVAESNQRQSIKGRQMVIAAIGNLGL